MLSTISMPQPNIDAMFITIVVLFLKRSLFLYQAYEEEVRKRDSGVNPSTQRLFDELTDKDITSSGRRLISAYNSGS